MTADPASAPSRSDPHDRALRKATLPDGRVDIKSLELPAIERLMADMGKPRFRALQVYKWLWQRGVASFDEMTNISKRHRAELDRRAVIGFLELERRLDSADGTRKYLWRCADGKKIESVMIPDENRPGPNPPRRSLCVSTQVGCAMACTFCLTGDMGLIRNLTPAEIATQALQVQRDLGPERRITNIVMMGMGEPLHNLAALTSALRILLDENALGYSHRRITVSTVGLVPAMRKLADTLPVNLAVSLNASTEAQREQVMPITLRYSLDELMAACRALPLPSGKRITFEYVMMAGFNDSLDDARRVVRLMQGVKAKVNLIPYNENPDRDIRRPSEAQVKRFQHHLVSRGVHCSVRMTRGRDISAACGQLGSVVERMAARVARG